MPKFIERVPSFPRNWKKPLPERHRVNPRIEPAVLKALQKSYCGCVLNEVVALYVQPFD